MKNKKILLLIIFALICNFLFAQMSYDELNDTAGLGVVYREKNGNFINLVNIGTGYIIRYRDFENLKACTATVKISKGFNTSIELIEMYEGNKEDFNTILKPKLSNLFFYTDMGMRKNLPGSFVTTKKDLFSGKVTKSGLVDFFIPITNLIWEKDENDEIITECIQFGALSPDELSYFLDSADIPEPKNREMNKVKPKKSTKVTYNNFELLLPKNYVLDSSYYVLPDTTKMDSIIYTDKISLTEAGFKDFYAYILSDILSSSMKACVVPTSYKMEKIGNAICITYDVITYDYWELNTVKLCLFSEDGENFDVLRINGYSSFIEKNIDMINKIIETAKVKK